ncbi:MAG: Asp-tRNA(Asn)/Glu-tRNA(Gln) amidotransferase subunit GatC [Candidatus Hydrogenedentota bacterium]|nr:MAG: Asp-tRNA(Asn)/Glu-tRNA(Gln) amidotransferase subunit GatC [Candidatus Hydrogenedentota bacterium]
MKVSHSEVRRIANLARLRVEEDEVSRLSEEMSRILEFAETIRELDTEGIEPTTHVIELTDVWREDEPRRGLERARVLENAPHDDGACFVTPRIG